MSGNTTPVTSAGTSGANGAQAPGTSAATVNLAAIFAAAANATPSLNRSAGNPPNAAASTLTVAQLLQQGVAAFPFTFATNAPKVPAKREWLYGNDLARRYVTMLTAPGGTGKTALAVGIAICLATGKDVLGTWVHSRLRVLLVNGEDGANEMWIRVLAAAQHHGLDVHGDLDDHLAVMGADDARVRLVRVDPRTRMAAVDPEAVARLEQAMIATRADVLIVDPMVRLSEAPENDAGAADTLAGELTGLAIRRDAAVLALHHNRKGARADVDGADAARGSSASVNAARVVNGITPVRPEEATKLGVMPDDAWRHFSVDNVKANLAPITARRHFVQVSVRVNNPNPARGYPEGDSVQVVARYTPRSPGDLIDSRMREAALKEIERGCLRPDGKRVPLSPNNAGRGNERYAVPRIAKVFKVLLASDSEPQCEMLAKAALNELTDVGAVREVMARIPGKGKAKGNERAALEVVPGVIPRSPGSPVPGVVQEATQGAQEPPGAPTTTTDPGAAEVAQADPGAAARGVAGGGATWINRASAEVGASLAAGLPVAPVIDRLVSELPAPTMPDPFTKGSR